MQELHLVGITTDRRGLILSTVGGARSGGFVVPVDEDLRTLIDRLVDGEEDDVEDDGEDPVDQRVTSPSLPSRRGRSESTLPIREVQARLRAGETLTAVARAAGVDEEWVERFALPVWAEQRRIVERALESHLERPRAGQSVLSLRRAVSVSLAVRGIAMTVGVFDAAWSSRLIGQDRWAVEFTYTQRGRSRTVAWDFDSSTGVLTTEDRVASQLGFVAEGERVTTRMGEPNDGIVGDPKAPVDAGAPAAESSGRGRTSSASKRAAKKKSTGRKPAGKKSPAKTPAAKKSAAKRAPAKKSAAKKPAAKGPAQKSVARTAPATKPPTKRSVTAAASTSSRRRDQRTQTPATSTTRPADDAPAARPAVPVRTDPVVADLAPAVPSGDRAGLVPPARTPVERTVERTTERTPAPAARRPEVASRPDPVVPTAVVAQRQTGAGPVPVRRARPSVVISPVTTAVAVDPASAQLQAADSPVPSAWTRPDPGPAEPGEAAAPSLPTPVDAGRRPAPAASDATSPAGSAPSGAPIPETPAARAAVRAQPTVQFRSGAAAPAHTPAPAAPPTVTPPAPEDREPVSATGAARPRRTRRQRQLKAR